MREKLLYRLLILPSARRQLLQLPKPAIDRVRQAIRQLATDPTPPDSLAMSGKAQGLHRLRVGAYRVVYRIQDDQLIVLVIRVGHRADVYRGFERRRNRPK